MLTDLENSVELSDRLDPEDLREVLAAYQQVCATVIRRFEGFVARYLGDGILVYFGYPTAHEDEAIRAVRSALGIVQAFGQLNARLERDHAVRLHCRIGIHTGLVVAGDIAPGAGLETMAAIGETPNVAARLQALASPDSVVVSAATYQLIAGYFNCRELGFKTLRGISQPMAIYEVLNESGARTRLDVAAVQGLTPLVGRDDELGLLQHRWQQATQGDGRAMQVEGEPGIGKSRLIWALMEHVAQSTEASLIRSSCSTYFQNTAYYPVSTFLEQVILQFEPTDTVDQRLNKIEGYLLQMGVSLPENLPLVAELLSVPFQERYAALDLPADRRRQLTIDALVQLVHIRASQQPVLFVIEDVHWADPSTLDYLNQLVERSASQRLFVILSARPEAETPGLNASRMERLVLTRLDPDASAAIVTQIAERPLPLELLTELLNKADGVPLYLEELTKLILELGLLQRVNGHFELTGPIPQLAIPATLADSLTARLDRLSAAKSVAQLGATIGRQFSYDLLVNVLSSLDELDESRLADDLDRLVDAGMLLVQTDSRGRAYTFKHALIQDVAYGSLLRPRRQQYHQRIAAALSQPQQGGAEVAPELLAFHYKEAGLVAESIPLWLRAGKRALQASANPEAIAHLSTGLELLSRLPESADRLQQELEFRLTIGPALMATRGYGAAEVEACYGRARELCRLLGDAPQLAPVLHGLWTYHIVRAQHHAALELAREVLHIGSVAGDEALQIQGNMDAGWSHYFLGRPAEAQAYLERVEALYDFERHGNHVYIYGDDPSTSAGSNLSMALWVLGYPDQAARRSLQTVATLRSVIKHPYTIAFNLFIAAVVRQYRGDVKDTGAIIDEVIALSREQSLAFIEAMAVIMQGWVLTRVGRLDEGLGQMRRGLAAQLATGAGLAKPYWLCLSAEVCRDAGAAEEGLSLLREAEDAVAQTEERYWEAEIYRLQGVMAPPDWEESRVEASFQRALVIARGQGAKSLELRAATSLATRWQRTGRATEARDVLLPVYSWFTEGFDTPDHLAATRLLAELGVPERNLHSPILLGGGR
jgi:class 3 adenylate cyclase/predicted ATPase